MISREDIISQFSPRFNGRKDKFNTIVRGTVTLALILDGSLKRSRLKSNVLDKLLEVQQLALHALNHEPEKEEKEDKE